MPKKFSLKKSPTSGELFVKKGASLNYLYMPKQKRKKEKKEDNKIIFMGRTIRVEKLRKT